MTRLWWAVQWAYTKILDRIADLIFGNTDWWPDLPQKEVDDASKSRTPW